MFEQGFGLVRGGVFMTRVAGIVLARPRAALAAWCAVIALLGLCAVAVPSHIATASLSVAHSQSAKFDHLYKREFGATLAVPIVLEGPRADLDAQGPKLVSALARIPHARVLSPWSESAAKKLRPSSTTALVAASIDLPQGPALRDALHRAEHLAHDSVTGSVKAYVTGEGPLAESLKDSSFAALHSRERIALVILALVLLLVLGSPVAAAIPAVAGAAAVVSGYGLIALLSQAIRLDQMTVSIASMMGLALGVDYALLMVARFREELAARGGEPSHAPDAALAATTSAGRTILLAGSMLVAAMLAATAVMSGGLLVSAAVGVILVAVVSVASALVAVPAAILLFSEAIGRPRSPRLRLGRIDGAAVTGAVLRRPALVTLIVGAALLALAIPAAGLHTGAPDARQLPASSQARADFENVRRIVGPGYATPFELVAVTHRGSITDPARLRAFRAWERRISADPDVKLVVGPGAIASRATKLAAQVQRIGAASAALADSRRALAGLGSSVGQAGAQIRSLHNGTARAGSAAQRLAAGSAAGIDGAGRVRTGLGSATSGVDSLRSGLTRARGGAQRLQQAADRPLAALRSAGAAVSGATRRLASVGTQAHNTAQELALVQSAMRTMAGNANSIAANTGSAQSALREASAALDSVRTWDPRVIKARNAVTRALAAVDGAAPTTSALSGRISRTQAGVDDAAGRASRVATQTDQASAGLGHLRALAATLATAMQQLRNGNATLATTLDRLFGGSSGLSAGLKRLTAGATRLDRGLGGLRASATAIAQSLNVGASRSGDLASSLQQAGGKVGSASARLAERRSQSPTAGLENSAYLTLAALDRARPGTRAEIATVVNLDRGGTAGHLVVIPRSGPNSPETAALARRLRAAARDLAAATSTTVAVGGAAATVNDYGQAVGRSLWLVIAALAAVTLVLLALAFRSLRLAAVLVGLNLVTVAAAFGALALLFQGSAPLGGPGYLDAIAATAILTIMFGLSIDYQVFLLARIRDARLAGADTRLAVEEGLRRTAHVIGGAALIMTAVFLTFGQADVANVRQFGVGMAIAVLLDATVVRLLLLPAVLTWLGDRAWGPAHHAPRRRRNPLHPLPHPALAVDTPSGSRAL
jgi:RND superfamily putative drug exporter